MKQIKVSDESYNSHGMRVLTAGGDFDRFNMNPVMLFNHVRAGKGNLPPGRWSGLQVVNQEIFATPEFDLEDEFGKELAGKYERGFIKGVSMSVYINEMVIDDGLMEDGRNRYTITKWELREISLTDIPSNKNTVKFYDKNDEQVEVNEVIAQFSADNSNKPKIIPPMDKNYQNVPGLLGLSANAEEAVVEQTIRDLKAENARLKTEQETQANARAESLVDLAIKEEKIDAKERDNYLTVAKADFSVAEDIIKNLPVRKTIKLSDIPKKVIDGGTASFTYEGKTFKDLQKENPTLLMSLKESNFETFNQLYKASYGKDYQK